MSNVNTDMIYSYLIDSAKQKQNTTLQVSPLLLGERHCPCVRGTVTNICSGNCSVGDISLAVMKGIIDNLKEMMPLSLLQQLQVSLISTIPH